MRLLLPFLTLVVLSTGCLAGLKLTPIKSTENKPSNVAIYFKVETLGGDPVGGLTAEQFKIYEDESLVSQTESMQTILNPEVAAAHFTLLLVDMSGSVTKSGNVDKLVEAADTFNDRIEKQQKVAVFAFDGDEEIHPIVPFTDSSGSAKAGIKQLSTYKPQDPSTNLNGAVVKALDELEKAVSRSDKALRFGTLVVFTDGTDHASRVSAEDMRKKVRDSKHSVFAIGLGSEINPQQLKQVGRDGTAMAADKDAVVKAFDTIGTRIEASTRSYYLLSYCSPARAGKHVVRIEASYKDKDGKNEQTGSLRREFDATGFTKGCDPTTPPSFDTSKGDALAPPKTEKETKPEPKETPKGTTPKPNPPPPNLPPPPPPKEVFTP